MENAAAKSIRTVRMRSEGRIFLFKILEEPGAVNDHNEYEEDKADGE